MSPVFVRWRALTGLFTYGFSGCGSGFEILVYGKWFICIYFDIAVKTMIDASNKSAHAETDPKRNSYA